MVKQHAFLHRKRIESSHQIKFVGRLVKCGGEINLSYNPHVIISSKTLADISLANPTK